MRLVELCFSKLFSRDVAMQNQNDVVKGMSEQSLNGPANLLREDISLPAVVLYQSRLQNNLS